MSDNLSDKSLRTFYCRDLGCANGLSAVFCGEDSLLEVNQTIGHCSGPPELNQICQQDSRVYATTTENNCDFEGVNPYLPTSECTDLDPCNWSDVTTLPSPLYNNNGTDIGAGGNYTLGVTNGTLSPGEPPPGNTQAVYWAIGGIVVVVAVVVLIYFFIYRPLKKICENNNWINGRKRNKTNRIPSNHDWYEENKLAMATMEPFLSLKVTLKLSLSPLHPQVELDTIV
ncbi:uncharacterized protein LOC130526584 isoform X2 [Takifugu flavidus]|uniref:uncharacterized protein LOC130526584 isoform X2 n=1 Tax=Takifugu flavidus TaxID=433684 RepID=UPI0025443E62|nr:uncharacterized protein LOC130526584 isoform X2 [Takifugu flavidus]